MMILYDPFLHTHIRDMLSSPSVLDACCKTFSQIGREYGQYVFDLDPEESCDWVLERIHNPARNLTVRCRTCDSFDEDLLQFLNRVKGVHLPFVDDESLGTVLRLRNLISLKSSNSLFSHLDYILNDEIQGLDLVGKNPRLGEDIQIATTTGRLGNLKHLGLDGDWPFNDLRILAPLSKLVSLDVSHSMIEDLEPLSQFRFLEKLDISGTRVENIQPLQICSKTLTVLRMTEIFVGDLSPLERFTSLKSLTFGEGPITDLSPLRSLAGSLIHLHITWIGKVDISPLSTLMKLETLKIDNGRLTDLKFIANPRLRELYLPTTPEQIQNDYWQPLSSLTQMIKLDLTQARIPNLNPLFPMTQLVHLALGHLTTDLAGLRSFVKLESLAFDLFSGLDCMTSVAPNLPDSARTVRFVYCSVENLETFGLYRPELSIYMHSSRATLLGASVAVSLSNVTDDDSDFRLLGP